MREYKRGQLLKADDINKLIQAAHRHQVKFTVSPPLEITANGGGHHIRLNQTGPFFALITYQDPTTGGCTWQEVMPVSDGEFGVPSDGLYGYYNDNPAFEVNGETGLIFPAYAVMYPGFTWDDGEQEYLFVYSGPAVSSTSSSGSGGGSSSGSGSTGVQIVTDASCGTGGLYVTKDLLLAGSNITITQSSGGILIASTSVSLNSANTFTVGPQTVQTGADANKGLIVKANSASQSANLVEVQNNSGTAMSYFDNNGSLILNAQYGTSVQNIAAINIQPNASSISYASLIKATAGHYTLMGIQSGGGPFLKGLPYIWFGDPADTTNPFIQLSPTYQGVPLMALYGHQKDQVNFKIQGGNGQTSDCVQVVNYGGSTLTKVTATGSLVVGGAALSTSATDGFLYVPTCAGAPTGTPTTQTGTAPVVYDTTDNKLYIYNGGWKSATFT